MEPSQSLEPLLRGDPVEAMETAKQIIGGKLAVDLAGLEAVLLDRKSRKWARIAAIYSLGFLDQRSAVPALTSILSDRSESVLIRAHSAEALGNIGDAEAVPALAQIPQKEVSPRLRRSSLSMRSKKSIIRKRAPPSTGCGRNGRGPGAQDRRA